MRKKIVDSAPKREQAMADSGRPMAPAEAGRIGGLARSKKAEASRLNAVGGPDGTGKKAGRLASGVAPDKEKLPGVDHGSFFVVRNGRRGG
jgi:hypothetical protein